LVLPIVFGLSALFIETRAEPKFIWLTHPHPRACASISWVNFDAKETFLQCSIMTD